MGGEPPSVRARTTARVRASVVRVREQFVLARYGKLAREQYRAAASPGLLQVLGAPADSWADFGFFVESTELACKLFGDGSPRLARDIGAYGAEANVGPWRTLVHRMLSPRLILEIAGMLWKHHYDGGRLASRALGDKRIALRIEDFPEPHAMHCTSIEGWCERTLGFSRPKSIRVWQASCRAKGDESCEFEGEWE